MLASASALPPTITSGRAGPQLWGRRKTVASSSNSSASTSTTIATDASTLPEISANARWLKNFTTAVRGLSAGLAPPRNAGASPCSTPTLGAPLTVAEMMIPLSRYSRPPASVGAASLLRHSDSRATCALVSLELAIGLQVYGRPGRRAQIARRELAPLRPRRGRTRGYAPARRGGVFPRRSG